jgi:hypothetical protein
MLCQTCRWTGRPGFVRAPRDIREDPLAIMPCPDCGGQGIAHCCDGICEQPIFDASNTSTWVRPQAYPLAYLHSSPT